MIYTKATKAAMKLCFEVHEYHRDKAGMPYVFHPFHIAEQMETEDAIVVALLHDVMEDSDYTLEDLKRRYRFSDAVLNALQLLTRDKSVPYMEYIAKLKDDPIAAAVKRADLIHNSDLTRMDIVDDRALKRVEKYRKALELLDT